MNRRYCGPCDEYTNANPCKACGADTDKLPVPVHEDGREQGDDDSVEYADPRDARDARRGLD